MPLRLPLLPLCSDPHVAEPYNRRAPRWNTLEIEDNCDTRFAIKLYELCKLPTRAFPIERLTPLGEEEQLELHNLTTALKAENPEILPMDAEQEAELMSDKGTYDWFWKELGTKAREVAEATADAADHELSEAEMMELVKTSRQQIEDLFWSDQHKRVISIGARPSHDTFQLRCNEVYETLQHMRFLPDSADAYVDMKYHGNAIYHRAMMRYVPFKEMQSMDVAIRASGRRVPHPQVERPAHDTYALLSEFAKALSLASAQDLLRPNTFTEAEHKWVQMHNRIRRGDKSNATSDKAVQEQLLAMAKVLLGANHGLNGGKPKTPAFLVEKVLTKVCAMKPEKLHEAEDKVTCGAGTADGRANQLLKWEINEVLPGYAEKMLLPLLTPDGMFAQEHAGQWVAEHTRLYDEAKEREHTRAQRDQFYEEDMQDAGEEDLPMEDAPDAPPARRFDPYVEGLKEKYDAEKLKGLRNELRPMLSEVLSHKEQINTRLAQRRPVVGDDAPEVIQLEDWYRALVRCEGLAQILETLHITASEEIDAHGRRSLRVKYEHSGATEGRLYSKSDVAIPSEKPGRPPRQANLPGMMNDARPPLIGATAFDIDAVNSDFHLLLGMIERDGLQDWARRVRQYVVERRGVLNLIMQTHSVDEDTAKRLPNRVMNGGDYASFSEGCLEADGLEVTGRLEFFFVCRFSGELRGERLSYIDRDSQRLR